MSENGTATRKIWDEVWRVACDIAVRMNEPGSEFAYECKPAPAGNSKDDSFVVTKKETRRGGQVVPIALFSFQPDTEITVQVKPTGYVKTFEVKADGTFANFQGTIYDLVDEVMFQLPQIPI